jgi:hypothetical protein
LYGLRLKRSCPPEVSTQLLQDLFGLLALLFLLSKGDLNNKRPHEVSGTALTFNCTDSWLGFIISAGMALRDTVLARLVHSSYRTALALFGLLALLFLLSRGDLKSSRQHEVSTQLLKHRPRPVWPPSPALSSLKG